MTKSEIKRFKRFLKENGAYKSFIRNYDPSYAYGRSAGNRVNTINEYLDNVTCVRAIVDAFDWSRTNEVGGWYWGSLDAKWLVHSILNDTERN